jgi:hypothetical protein
MKIKNFILENEIIFETLKKFMSFKMSIATMFSIEPSFEKYVEAKNKVYSYKLKAYEKYACPVFGVDGKLIRYTVEGCTDENKEKLNLELNELLNEESEISDKLTVDLKRIDGDVIKEELNILKMFFNFTV